MSSYQNLYISFPEKAFLLVSSYGSYLQYMPSPQRSGKLNCFLANIFLISTLVDLEEESSDDFDLSSHLSFLSLDQSPTIAQRHLHLLTLENEHEDSSSHSEEVSADLGATDEEYQLSDSEPSNLNLPPLSLNHSLRQPDSPEPSQVVPLMNHQKQYSVYGYSHIEII